MQYNLNDITITAQQWAVRAFPQSTPASLVEHLRREVEELANAPADPLEIADVYILIADLAARQGVDLSVAVRQKMAINANRRWGKPDAQGVTEHVEDGYAALSVVQWDGKGAVPAILRRQCDPVKHEDPYVAFVAKELQRHAAANKLVGLAAPQIGVASQIIVVIADVHKLIRDKESLKPEDYMVCLNPAIVEQHKLSWMPEGCHSFPTIGRIMVRRFHETKVAYDLPDGDARYVKTFYGLQAQCFQHEIDHLYGRVILDHTATARKSDLMRYDG